MWSDAGLVEQLWRQLADQGLDLACELSFLGLQLQDASSDRAQGEQAAAGAGTATWMALAAALVGCLFVPYVKAAFETTARISFPTSRLSFGRDARMLTIAICAVALQPLAGLVAVASLSAVEAVTRSAIAFRTLRRQAAERQQA